MRSSAASQVCQQSRRDAILAAAEAIFAEDGYDRARLEDVARRVGIRRASLLYHFRDKAALYTAVLDSMSDDLAGRRELADGVSEHSRPFAERARSVLDAVGDVITEGQETRALRPTSGLHVMLLLTGASAFLMLGGALVSTGGTDRFPVVADRAQHRELLITIYRKLLGTRGPRPRRALRTLEEPR